MNKKLLFLFIFAILAVLSFSQTTTEAVEEAAEAAEETIEQAVEEAVEAAEEAAEEETTTSPPLDGKIMAISLGAVVTMVGTLLI